MIKDGPGLSGASPVIKRRLSSQTSHLVRAQLALLIIGTLWVLRSVPVGDKLIGVIYLKC